ncbi:MAG: glycosyltransferase family 39 protein [Candidatus Methanoperedens sp.]|nr:glycosyltransferase family 39 protein [Candidatus Methanoperedens sp.]
MIENNIINYWLYSIAIIIIAFAPGFLVASRLHFLTLIEKFVISFGLGFFIIILLSPLTIWNPDIARVLFLILVIISVFMIYKNRNEILSDRAVIFLLIVLLMNFASKFFLQFIWEYPVIGGDWFDHGFIVPYNFSIGDWTPERDRPPFFGLLIFVFHKLVGTSVYQYWLAQLVSTIANSILFLPAYLIGRRVFSEQIARISVLFILVTPYIVENSIYPWPKNLAAYFILLMIYFMFFSGVHSRRNLILAGFFGGLSFLIHNYATVYIATALLIYIYQNCNRKINNYIINLKSNYIFYFIAVLILVVLPYLIWLYSYYGTIFVSNFKYYPFAVKGYLSALTDPPDVIFQSFHSASFQEIIWIRISNTLITLFPLTIPLNPYMYSHPSYVPTVYYNGSYAGMLSFGMYILVLLSLYRYITGRIQVNKVLVIFIVLPFLFHIFLFGWIEWGLHFMSFPTNPFLIMLGFNELYKFKNYKFIRNIVFLGGLAETIIYEKLQLDFYENFSGRVELGKAFQEYISGFQIDRLISAHFLMTNRTDMYINLLIMLLILLSALFMTRKYKIEI